MLRLALVISTGMTTGAIAQTHRVIQNPPQSGSGFSKAQCLIDYAHLRPENRRLLCTILAYKGTRYRIGEGR